LTFTQFFALVARQNRAEEILDLRSGIIASVIANVNGDGSKNWTPDDFRLVSRPRGDGESVVDVEDLPLETPTETMDIIAAINKAWGGTDLRQKTT
jgi:hypothetical protein